ncbi:hypothetical protein LTS12_023194 [Elasticomyces elasticus]|nr:hypothetical protein LTS12_023194 [Elasticomyces elasticus]
MLAPFHSQPFRQHPAAPDPVLPRLSAAAARVKRWAPLQTGAPLKRAARRNRAAATVAPGMTHPACQELLHKAMTPPPPPPQRSRRPTSTPKLETPPVRALVRGLPRSDTIRVGGRKRLAAAVAHWEVKRIVGCERGRNGQISYWVLWEGSRKPTLQHERDLRVTADLAVAQYHQQIMPADGAGPGPSRWFRARYGDDEAGWPADDDAAS